jgi:hypothetical protein
LTPGDLDVLVLFVSAPSPTAERREAMLGELAEWLHAAAHRVQRELMAAEEADEVVRLAGALTKLARGVRQCVLMHDRLEGQRLAAETDATRGHAEAEAAAHAEALDRQKTRVRRAVERRFEAEWPATEDVEDDDAFNERLERLDERLDDLAHDEGFLAVDADILITALCEEFGVAPPAFALIAAPAGTQAGSAAMPSPPPPQGSPPSRGRAADGAQGANTS